MNLIRKISKKALGTSALCFLTTFSFGNNYSVSTHNDPGLSYLREFQGDSYEEFIDPHTGGVKFINSMLEIPGQGGLDIEISRVYNSIFDQDLAGRKISRSPFGLGWDINFGRVWTYDKKSLSGSYCPVRNVSTVTNPIFEDETGARKVLANTTRDLRSYHFITTDQWVGKCSNGGMKLYSPAGLTYEFTKSFLYTVNKETTKAYPVTKISDRFGNYLTFSYNDKGFIEKISANDGRRVDFKYSYQGSGLSKYLRLDRISSAGRSWDFKYERIILPSNHKYFSAEAGFLTEVRRPDGSKWRYEYRDVDEYGRGDYTRKGLYSVKRAITPSGGVSDYRYDRIQRSLKINEWSTVVSQIDRSGTTNGGRWTYSYEAAAGQNDKTTVKAPDACIVYHHVGNDTLSRGVNGIDRGLWTLGNLIKKETYPYWRSDQCASKPIRVEENLWGKQKISDQNYFRRDLDIVDKETHRPILLENKITQDGSEFKTNYSHHDQYGNARTITERVVGKHFSGSAVVKKREFFKPSGYWILGLVSKESVDGIRGNVVYKYDKQARKTQEIRYGISTSYGYDRYGQLSYATDANGRRTSFSNYYRGTPRSVSYPDGSSSGKVISDRGTVTSATDQRGYKTHFSYNDLNLLTGVIPPKGRNYQSSITHHFNNSTSGGSYAESLNRAGFTQTKTFNGSGSLKSIETRSGSQRIVKGYQYDHAGRKTSETLPYYYGQSIYRKQYNYDAIGRLTRVTHSDGSSKQFEYLSNNAVSVTDERGYTTKFAYVSYGSPDNKLLTEIATPEGVTTVISRDQLGRIKSVSQSGKVRSYTYDQNLRLSQINHPEIGAESFTYDRNGNQLSRTVGGRTTRYTYDAMNRLLNVLLPGDSVAEVNHTYDSNGNLTSTTNSISAWNYGYDSHNNLISEKLSVNGRPSSFDITNSYNSMDVLSGVTLPSGLYIDYQPDGLGRPRKAGGYISGVNYFANGNIRSMTYGNGQTLSMGLNNRQRISSLRVAKGDSVVDHRFGYDYTGNITSITDYVDNSYSLSMGYDGQSRLTQTSGHWGSSSFAYNRLGDLTRKTQGADALNYQYAGNGKLSSVSGMINASYGYDVYGNVTDNGRLVMAYDDFSNLISACKPASNEDCLTQPDSTYQYDALNRRISSSGEGKSTYTVYSNQGLLLFEEDRATGKTTDYVYLGTNLVAKRELCGIADSDGDSIPDCYEQYIGSNPDDGLDGGEDVDGDGTSNREEYQQYVNGQN